MNKISGENICVFHRFLPHQKHEDVDGFVCFIPEFRGYRDDGAGDFVTSVRRVGGDGGVE